MEFILYLAGSILPALLIGWLIPRTDRSVRILMKILNVTALIALAVGACEWLAFFAVSDPFALISVKYALAVGGVYIAAMSAVAGHQWQR